jgi:hypothetical protein
MPAQGGNVGFQMTPFPVPEAAQPSVQTSEPRQNDMQAPPQMPPVYYGGKTGGAAYLADNVLKGWLSGVKMGHERKAQQMSQEVSSAKTGLDLLGQAYNAAQESGDAKRITETKAALSEAWSDYLNKAEKYAMPEPTKGGKKSAASKVGGFLKEGFGGGENPHLNIAHSTLDILRKTDPTQFYGRSKEQQDEAKLRQQQSELFGVQLDEAKKAQSQKDTWEKIAQIPTEKLTPEQVKQKEYLEYTLFGKSKAEQQKDFLLEKAISGKLPATGPEHDLAIQLGVIRPDVTSTQLRTVDDGKGHPKTQVVAFDQNGKLVGQPYDLPGKDYVPPDQAQIAQRTLDGQVRTLVNWSKKAHPEWDEKTRYQFALSAVTSGQSRSTDDWFMKNQEQDVMSRGLQAVLTKHQHYSQSGGRTYDDIGNAMQAFIGEADGRYSWVPNLGPKETHWFGKDDTYGGYTQSQLRDYENTIRTELRTELKKLNPKLDDAAIDRMMPQSMFTKSGQMAPPPGAGSGAAPQAMSTPPGAPGSQKVTYTMTRPDGSVVAQDITEEEKYAMEQDRTMRGVSFVKNSGMSPQDAAAAGPGLH